MIIINKKYILLTSLIACIFLYFVEQVLIVDYFVKTLSKILLFTIIPYVYIKFIKKTTIKEAINYREIDKHHLKMGLLFGIASFVIIFIAYFIFKDVLNLNVILAELQNKSKISQSNFIFVGLYVTLCNSFLEEFFFRGFIFLNLYELKLKKSAYVYSSLLFGIYHMSIFKTWFNIWLILLALVGLISAGFILDWIDTKSSNFINSWIVHILADSAIILIGMKMFVIL